MPEFSFDVVDDDGTRTDGVHKQYRHADDAKAEACRAAAAMAGELFAKQSGGSISVEVMDRHGKAIARARVMFSCDDLD
jgi:hypothetical protein